LRCLGLSRQEGSGYGRVQQDYRKPCFRQRTFVKKGLYY
jgi:hypothetical protein